MSREAGLSLVEVTIILMVLFLLTGVLTPVVGDYLADARQVKAKEDIEAIGTAIVRLLRDTGLPFPVLNPREPPANLRLATNRVDLFIGDGNAPTSNDLGITGSNSGYMIAAAVDWDATNGASDQIANMNFHIAYNTINANSLEDTYTLVAYPAPGGPLVALGWRGPYLTGPVGPDPWGSRYAANTVFLGPSSDSTTTGTGTNFDTFVLSAGPDGSVSTDMEGNGLTSGGTTPGGDDVIYVITGNTR